MADEIHITVEVPTRAATVTVVDPPAEVTIQVDGAGSGGGGGGGGAPSGPAGGVLGGTYPNPSFAADMATQAELNAVAGQGAGGVLSGSYPNPGFAVDMVEQTELTAAISAHAGATDPHGDRAYALGLVDDLSGVSNAATARTNLGLGTAAVAASGDFDPAGSAAAAQAAAIAASQPVDSDLTSIAALSTTSYGRAFLALADAAAGRTALGLGTAAVAATGDFDAAGAATTAQAAAIAASVPIVVSRQPIVMHHAAYSTNSGGTLGATTTIGSYLAVPAGGSYVEWTPVLSAGTWRFRVWLLTTNGGAGSTAQLAVGGSNLGTAINTYDATGTNRVYDVDTDKVIAAAAATAVRLTPATAQCRLAAVFAWRVD